MGAVTFGSIEIVMALDVTVAGDGQAALLVITTLIAWPLVMLFEEKYIPVAPDTGLPLIIH